jgi:hypothetical protein
MAGNRHGVLDAFRSGLVGLVFLSAGVSKVLRPRGVRNVVAGYRLLPEQAVGPVARALGPVEIATGSLLLVAPLVGLGRQARAVAGIELLVFSAAVGSALTRGIRIPCGCGPIVGDHVIGPSTIVRNLAMAAVVLAPGATSPASS